MKPKPQASPSIWESLDQIRVAADLAESPDIPPDAISVAQYAERYGIPEATARGQLLKLARSGKLQSGNRYERGSDGRRLLIKCYWVLK